MSDEFLAWQQRGSDRSELHCFSDDTDTVVALSVEDALVVWCEHTGIALADATAEFLQEDDARVQPIAGDEGVVTHRTNRAWCDHEGRGFLCSTEY